MDALLVAKLIGHLLLPPSGLFLLLLLGWYLVRRRAWPGKMLTGISLLTFFLLCSPWFSDLIRKPLEAYPALGTSIPNAAQAIVVLGGGRNSDAPEYGGDTVSTYSLERIRYAATLHQRTGLPLLLSGGKVFGESLSEALLMKQALVDEFQVPVVWLEEESRNTFENAKFSQSILADNDIGPFLIVTHAWHMPRTMRVFEQLGMRAIPAPTGFRSTRLLDVWSFVPSAGAFQRSAESLREYLGLAWYRLRY